MELKLDRKWKRDFYTIGVLYVNGVRFCETCEDTDRGLKQTDSLAHIKAVKIPTETAIPRGKYEVRMDIVSPKYSQVSWYKNLCGGRMPRIMDVPSYEGILIHPGTTALDSGGCVLVGKNKIKGGLTQSRATFASLYNKMQAAYKKGEKITIEIV